jgi:hypothetical protein
MSSDIIPIFGILLAMIPVAGLTLGLTLRLAVKPFVETLARAVREAGGPGGADTAELSARMESFQEELEGLRAEAMELRKAQEFDRKLIEATSGRSTGTGTDA